MISIADPAHTRYDSARMLHEQKSKLELKIAGLLFLDIARRTIDPVWEPIRDDPGFQELLKIKECGGP